MIMGVGRIANVAGPKSSSCVRPPLRIVSDSSGRTAATCAQEPPGPRDGCAKSGDRGRGDTAAPLDR
jgi:hypothetical protein